MPGAAVPYGEGAPLHVLGEALRHLVDEARDRGILHGHSPDFDEALAYLGSGLLRDGSPGDLPDQLAWAAALVLETIGRRLPVLLIVDDLHAAKPVLLDVLAQLVGRMHRRGRARARAGPARAARAHLRPGAATGCSGWARSAPTRRSCSWPR